MPSMSAVFSSLRASPPSLVACPRHPTLRERVGQAKAVHEGAEFASALVRVRMPLWEDDIASPSAARTAVSRLLHRAVERTHGTVSRCRGQWFGELLLGACWRR